MNQKKWIRHLDYFYIARPMLFFPGWNTLLAGYLVAKGEINLWQNIVSGSFQWHIWIAEVALMMLTFAAAMGGSFIMNQLQEVESDKQNKKLFLIGEKYMSWQKAFIESILLILTAVGISLIFNIQEVLLIIFFVIITGYLYNFPPFQYKNHPFMGLYLNMLMGWIAFALGWSILKNLNLEFFLHSLPYLFLNTGLYFLTTVPDIEGDKAAGKQTFCVRFGIKTTARLCLGCYLLSVLTAILLQDYLILFILLLGFYWMVKSAYRPSVSSVIKTVKMVIFFFSAVICIKFPTYFLLMVFIFYLTKFYYRRRFQFNYPNFRGE